MSIKILKTLEDVMDEKHLQPELREFLREIVNFECFENTHHYKAKYRETLETYMTAKKRRG